MASHRHQWVWWPVPWRRRVAPTLEEEIDIKVSQLQRLNIIQEFRKIDIEEQISANSRKIEFLRTWNGD